MDFLEPIWTKPTGMHWRTIDRLLQAEEAAQHAHVVLMQAAMTRLEAAVSRLQPHG
jgi:hypothetical protein